jgi:GTP-binding protein LepA
VSSVPEQAVPAGRRVSSPAAPAPAIGNTPLEIIRNFCIIAHIDHGKSTLADRMLQFTGVVGEREMRAQYLDRMDIERERGITIKSQAVRLPWTGRDGRQYVLNLIDTPGHVDFSYEVSRSLAACEGAILLVDAAQGIEAQTLANLYLALDADLHLIPVLNKIDLPAAQPARYAEELARVIGCEPGDVMQVSAKTGAGVEDLLHAVVAQVPPPSGDPAAPARALIFDSVYDTYRGVVTYVRVVDGRLTRREKSLMMSTGAAHDTLEVGVISPEPTPADGLAAGEVGYLITGVKNVRQARVGDTVTSAARPAAQPLAGYGHPRPMVFSGLYPLDGDDYPELRDALDKLRLNDAALVYEPETSAALGFGFRCGFLGLLHMEIVRERLEREFGLSLISTAPNVVYRVVLETGDEVIVTNPSEFPGGSGGSSPRAGSAPDGKVAQIFEPVVKATVLAPAEYIGTIMELCQSRRGALAGMEYLSEDRVEIHYTMPLAEIIFDFFDQLKSRTRGYASLDYEPAGEEEASLVKVDILLQGQPVDAFSQIVHADKARDYGIAMTSKLRELIPRQQFEVPIQAAIGSKIIARENIRALRKDVLAKCYGGDITRKRKLLEKQKEGKRRMKVIGRVEVPQEAFIAALSTTPDKR